MVQSRPNQFSQVRETVLTDLLTQAALYSVCSAASDCAIADTVHSKSGMHVVCLQVWWYPNSTQSVKSAQVTRLASTESSRSALIYQCGVCVQELRG